MLNRIFKVGDEVMVSYAWCRSDIPYLGKRNKVVNILTVDGVKLYQLEQGDELFSGEQLSPIERRNKIV